MSVIIEGKEYTDIDDITYEFEDSDFIQISESELEGKRRWVLVYSKVVQHKSSKKFFRVYWEEGATEQQEDSASDKIIAEEVFPKEVTTIVYVKR